MIYIIGEIVCDFFGLKADKLNFECNIGGAPLNLACNLANLHIKNKFLGYLSNNDIFTPYIMKEISKWNNKFSKYHLLTNSDCENAMYFSFVNKEEQSVRNHMYFTNDGSYRILNLKDMELFLSNSCKDDIIHFGSLMFANIEAYKNICKFLNKHKGKFHISFDFNFREHVHKSFDSDICKRMIKFIKKYVDILKVTKDELKGILKTDNFESELDKLNLKDKLIYITDNKNGAACYFQNKLIKKTAEKIENIVDTLGCGDAFYSGVLSVISKLDFKKISQKDIETSLIIGNRCGGLTLQKAGAINGFQFDDVFFDN